MRRAPHEGQKPRRLQLKASSLSWPQSAQRGGRKPWAKMPHSRKASNSSLTNCGRSVPTASSAWVYGALVQAVHRGELIGRFDAAVEGPAQRLAPGQLLVRVCERLLQQRGGFGVLGQHPGQVFLARRGGCLERRHQLRTQLQPQVFLGACLAAAEQLKQRPVDMFWCHRFDRLALKIVALVSRGDTLQVTRGTRMQAERGLETVAFEILRVFGQQLLEYSKLEREEGGSKKTRIELEQLFKYRLGGARTIRLGRCSAQRR